jgi:SAM-dependent methyltransferase
MRKADRLQAIDLVEAFQLAKAVAALHELNVLADLTTSTSSEELAARHKLDPQVLRGTLEFIAARTNLLRKSADRFVVTRNYAIESRFLFDLYIGAYGGNAANLKSILRDPSMANGKIDRASYAQAFAAADEYAIGILPEIITELKFDRMLDLGCGTSGLLLSLARQNSKFVGWGMDKNPAALKVARRRALSAGFQNRLRFFEGDCTHLRTDLPAVVRVKVESLAACNVANEMFRDGERQSIKWLQQLRKLFPERPLMIHDYYSRLGKKVRHGSVERRTLLHDYAQLISGQGIPPANAKEWRAIYSSAGVRLVHIIEDSATTRFIHILRL